MTMKRPAAFLATLDHPRPLKIRDKQDVPSASPFIFSTPEKSTGESFCSTGACVKHRQQQTRALKRQESDVASAQIAKDLLELSLKDRETLFEEIHGVAEMVEETEEFIESALKKLQTSISWTKEKSAYEQARFMLPGSVENRFLRLAMLRASDYDPTKAAKRMIAYFQYKRDTFGLDGLVNPLTQALLTAGMLRYLRSGGVQLLPSNDRVGRPIIFISSKFDDEKRFVNVAGAAFYLFDKMIQDESAQKKGYVVVNYTYEKADLMPSILAERAKNVSKFDAAIPIKLAAFHYSYDDSRLRPFLGLVQMAFDRSTRLRVKVHFGSCMESSYKLMSYGIVPSSLPIDQEGNMDNTVWRATVTKMREEEEARSISSKIVPTSRDCLLGRGYPYRRFPGTVALNDVIRFNQKKYALLGRLQKRVMLSAIVEYFQVVRGCRFLKRIANDDALVDPSESPWMLATNDEAISKTGNTMRHHIDSTEEESARDSELYTAADNKMEILVPVENRNEA